MYKEIPALYDIARQITLEAGMPWTDPRNGKTHQPPKQIKRRKRVPYDPNYFSGVPRRKRRKARKGKPAAKRHCVLGRFVALNPYCKRCDKPMPEGNRKRVCRIDRGWRHKVK